MVPDHIWAPDVFGPRECWPKKGRKTAIYQSQIWGITLQNQAQRAGFLVFISSHVKIYMNSNTTSEVFWFHCELPVSQSWCNNVRSSTFYVVRTYVVRNDHQVRCLIQLVRMWYARNAGKKLFSPHHLSISVWPLRPQFCTLGVLPKITFKLTIIGYRKNLQI